MKSEEAIKKKLDEIRKQINEMEPKNKDGTVNLGFERTVAKREELEWVLEK